MSKGKDLILTDYLSRANIKDEEDPNALIPATITTQDLQQAEYSSHDMYHTVQQSYGVMTRSQARQQGISPDPVHGTEQGIRST